MTQEEKEKAARIRWRRKHMTVRKTTLEESRDEPDPLATGSFEELLALNWKLTVEACEFGKLFGNGKYDTKRPFQRNVLRVIRPKR